MPRRSRPPKVETQSTGKGMEVIAGTRPCNRRPTAPSTARSVVGFATRQAEGNGSSQDHANQDHPHIAWRGYALPRRIPGADLDWVLSAPHDHRESDDACTRCRRIFGASQHLPQKSSCGSLAKRFITSAMEPRRWA